MVSSSLSSLERAFQTDWPTRLRHLLPGEMFDQLPLSCDGFHLLIHEDLRCLFWQCCLPNEGPVSPVMWHLSFPSSCKLSHLWEGISLSHSSSLKPNLAPWSFLWCALSLPSSSITTHLTCDPFSSCPTPHGCQELFVTTAETEEGSSNRNMAVLLPGASIANHLYISLSMEKRA